MDKKVSKGFIVLMLAVITIITASPYIMNARDMGIHQEESEIELDLEEDTDDKEESDSEEDTDSEEELGGEEPITLLENKSTTSKEKSSEFEVLVTGGYDFSIARLADGSWWSWGANEDGQLGHGDTENRLHPVKIDTELEGKEVKELVAVDTTVIVHLENGDVYTWGMEISQEKKYQKPTKVETAKSMGYSRGTQQINNHSSLALVKEGKVYVSGSGHYGQFGRGIIGRGAAELGTSTDRRGISTSLNYPVLIEAKVVPHENNNIYNKVASGVELNNVKEVYGTKYGRSYVAVTKDNEIYSWGSGVSSLARKNPNNTITGNILKVEVGNRNNIIALTSNGEVWEWSGVDGETKKVEGLTNVKDIVMYNQNIFILTESGDVYAKGNETYGEILGASSSKYKKVATNIKNIGMGYRHSFMVDENNKIFGSGWNAYRQLALEEDGVLEEFEKEQTLKNIDHVQVLGNSTITSRGNKLYAWGELTGDLGDTTNTPHKIKELMSDVISLKGSNSSAVNHMSIITESGNLYNTGRNHRKELGHNGGDYIIEKVYHNTKANAYIKNTAGGETYVIKEPLTLNKEDIHIIDAIQVSGGGAALDKTGKILNWGQDRYGLWGIGGEHKWDWGKDGIGSKTTEAYVEAKTDIKFKKVSGGSYTRVVLSRDGEVYTWGRNTSGSLGRTGDNTIPRSISGLSNIKEISMGHYTGLALHKNGNIYAWGYNNVGQLGDGSITSKRSPVNITNNINKKFVKVSSGVNTMHGITEDGELYAWGNNRYGQLGLGDRVNRTSPRKVEGLPKMKDVSSGAEHTVAIAENGDVYSVGGDSFGQLGLGKEPVKITNTEIPFPDYITLKNKDNTSEDINTKYKLEGDVTSLVMGDDIKVSYDIQGSEGIIDRGEIGSYKTSNTPIKFSQTINLDASKYNIGGYTATVTVKNKNTGLTNSSSVNFGILDTIPPSSPTIMVNPKADSWTNKDVEVTLKDGIDKESGVDNTSYRINEEDWKVYGGSFELTESGEHIIEAITIDNSGNTSKSVKETVKVDKQVPDLTLTLDNKQWTKGSININVKAEDKHSGLDKVFVNGENTIKNSDFSEGDKYWRDALFTEWESIKDGVLKIKGRGTSVLGSRIGQPNVLGQGLKEEYIVTIRAKGYGKLNSRFSSTGASGGIISRPQELKEDKYREYVYHVPYGKYRDELRIELEGEGEAYISSITMHETSEVNNNKIPVHENGTYDVTAVDKVGNATTESITITNIDKTPPKVKVSGNPTEWEESGKAVLKFTATDTQSGVKSITLPDNKEVLSDEAEYEVTSNGEYKVTVEDNAGNKTIENIKVDKLKIPFSFIARDSESKPVKWAKYELYKDGVKYKEAISDDEGLVDFGMVIPTGKYTVKIVSTPGGGNNSGEIEVNPGEDDDSIPEITVHERGDTLPATGTYDTLVYITIIALILGGLIYVREKGSNK